MKKKNSFFRILLFSLAGYMGCYTPSTNSNKTTSFSDLTGLWVWQFSTGGIAGSIVTPGKAGYTQKLSFTSDAVEFFRNDTFVSRSYFKVFDTLITFGDSITAIHFSKDKVREFPFMDFNQIEMRNDTLIIDPAKFHCADCFRVYYTFAGK
jgi:hypothetical protein